MSGKQKEKLPNVFKVATLNFSGINTNPFQYSDGSDMFLRLNSTVKELINLELPGLSDWKVGKLDKQYSDKRLSIGFSQKIQTADGKLLNRQEFGKTWMRLYNESDISSKLKSTKEELENGIIMDYVFYRVILIEVYKLSGIKQLEEKLKDLDANKLDDFLKIKFNRPASRASDKGEAAVKYLINKDLDIFFLQEASSCDWKTAVTKYEKYSVTKQHDSVIIYNKEKFGEEVPNHKIWQEIRQSYGKNIDFNEDTAIVFTTDKEGKDYLLFSAHLKSKKQKYLVQAKQMFNILRQIRRKYSELIIVIGMDSNHFVNKQHYLDQGKEVFYAVPQTDDDPSTVKQRSYLQAQFSKADVAVSQLKDQIVSSHPIELYQIRNIKDKQTNNQMLPSDQHPYDHYVVFAEIKK